LPRLHLALEALLSQSVTLSLSFRECTNGLLVLLPAAFPATNAQLTTRFNALLTKAICFFVQTALFDDRPRMLVGFIQ
jgi:hypothetical protein